ncbi:MAG: hypothetical protein EP318_07720 [Rhodobacteraceae bacterium]|nr:MAG: hypothetical protein EP318_07720 [Paracoccaceae bacterium]
MRHALAGLLSLALCAPLSAQEEGPVLRVTGKVAGGAVMLDMAALRALPATTLETSTVVTDGTHRFTGVLLRRLLGDLGAAGDSVTATALNDYAVEIPIRDFERFDVILAYEMDGAALRRADKGPLWIVYPRDAHPELQDIRYDYRWVWQLSDLEVR